MWSNCDNPIKLAKEVINNLNDKKIISINNELQNVKIYTAKENIEILKKNYKDYTNVEVQTQNMINSYESRIDELQQKIDEYIQKESDYQEKINNLKYQIIMYQNENEQKIIKDFRNNGLFCNFIANSSYIRFVM